MACACARPGSTATRPSRRGTRAAHGLYCDPHRPGGARRPSMPKREPSAMSRREFLASGGATLAAAGLGGGAMAASANAKPFEHDEATIAGLAGRMREGSLTAHALAIAYLERIGEIDAAGPALRAVIEVNPEAEEIAAARDRERREGRVRGPLHGVPILVKDN